MKSIKSLVMIFPMLLVGGLLGCSDTPPKSPDVTDTIRKSLDQAGYKDVSVSQDRDKGVVTLSGTVAADSDKAQAESIAKSAAAGQVVADQIAVRPPGEESTAKTVASDLDKGIEQNLDAALVKRRMDKGVSYDVKNGVVTLKGDVSSQGHRNSIAQIAKAVPNVTQVVNELQVKAQKATSPN
ncbi:MAG: BON domain-containing protein [Candidatus Acidiferrum sp.]